MKVNAASTSRPDAPVGNDRPPNILVMQTDDHAQWALGCYGNSELRTPSLDHLAATGVRMCSAFTPNPMCSPGRACFWTGRLPSQHGIHDALAEHDPAVRAVDWLAGERTLAHFLSEAGYVTGLSGKWHLGKGDFQREQAFDYWYSHSLPLFRPDAFESPWTMPAEHGTTNYNRQAIADHAIDFLRVRDRERPFFLYVGFIATHSPWSDHSERLARQYRTSTFRDIPDDPAYPFGRMYGESLLSSRADPRETRAQYYAAVSEIDEQVGRLIDELEAQGLTEETLVVYTSDHGMNQGQHGVWGKGGATSPYNVLEESIRVPLILSHPGTLLGGQSRDEMVTHCDLFQTILEHAGVVVDAAERERLRYPGRSFRAQCRGDARADWPEQVFGDYGPLRMIRTRDHKLVRRYPDGPNELFDLRRDPRETRSFFNDPAYADLVDSLTRRLEVFFAEYEDPQKSGLRVNELPSYGVGGDWTGTGEHRQIVATNAWLDRIRDRMLADLERERAAVTKSGPGGSTN